MTTEKQKKKTKKWTRLRHRIVIELIRPFFWLYFKLRYNLKFGKNEKDVPRPCIIMSNHLTTLDPFLLSLSFKRHVYYIASEDLFSIPVLSPIIRFLVAPIPKTKSKSDLGTIRDTLTVLKEGGSVGVFPEGNRSLSGGNWAIDPSAAKLVKISKVPLALFRIEGGYGTDPRWGKGIRRGKMRQGVVKVLSPEEIAAMSVDELHEVITSTLKTDDYALNVRFKNKRRAEYLERALYYCPHCQSFNTLRSDKAWVGCVSCGAKAEYGENLRFYSADDKIPYATTTDWFDAQILALKEKTQTVTEDEVLFSDKKITVRLIKNRTRRFLGAADVSADKEGITLRFYRKNKDFGEVVTLGFDETVRATVLGKRKINFYLANGETLQIKGFLRFNSIKYLHLYQINKKEI